MELSGQPQLRAVITEPSERHLSARILVRLHGEPLGYVSVPLSGGSITPQIVRIANRDFAAQIRRHLTQDGESHEPTRPTSEPMAAICPRRARSTISPPMTVAVCTRNRQDELNRCISHLRQLRYDGTVEVVIVDNAPHDRATRDLVQKVAATDPRFRYVLEPVVGLSAARNRALETASYDLVAFTDDDAIVDPSWLSMLSSGFRRAHQVGVVSGLVTSAELESASQKYFDGWYSQDGEFEPRTFGTKRMRGVSFAYPFAVGMVGSGANFAVDRSLVLNLGGFDSLLGIGSPLGGGEDLDLFARVLSSGHQIVREPSAIVWHVHPLSEAQLTERLSDWWRGLGGYLAKQLHDPRTRRMAWSRAAPGLVHLCHVWRRSSHNRRRYSFAQDVPTPSGVRGVLAGMRDYRRVRSRADRQRLRTT